WLQNLRSALVPHTGQRQRRRHGSLRAATHRPNLEVLEDRLTPSFSPATSFPVAANPQGVVAADFNHDGHLDLATANPYGPVNVLLGDGHGGFGAAIGPAASDGGDGEVSLSAADFNHDGNADLAMVNIYYVFGSRYTNMSVLLGNGDGTFR